MPRDERVSQEAMQADNYSDLYSLLDPRPDLVSLGLPLLAGSLRMECSGTSRCVTNATKACSVVSEDQGWL